MISMIYPIIVWGLGALTFMIQYACRVSPSVMIAPLRNEFAIEASEVGHLAAGFYYTYLAMQLFVGRIVDRYPAHRVLLISAAVFLFANQWFSESYSIQSAFFARMLQGAMGAFSFVVSMRLAMLWFDRQYLATLAGCTQVLGMLGVVFGNIYVDHLLIDTHWRMAIKSLSWLLLGLILLMIVLLKQNKHEKDIQGHSQYSISESLMKIMGNPQSWYNALYAGFLYLPTAAFGEFWGVDYLVSTHDSLTQHQASVAISNIFIGWALGGILIGILSDYLKKRQVIMSLSAILSFVLMLPVLYFNQMPVWLLDINLLLFGFVNTGLVLAYATAGELNGEAVSGTSVAFCNMGSILCGTLAMPLVGMMLDLLWSGAMHNGVRFYAAEDYLLAFSWMPVAFIIAFLLSRFVEDQS